MVTNVPEQLQTPMNRCEQPQSCAVRHTNRLTEEPPQNAPDPSHICSESPLTSSAAYDAPYRRQPHQRRTKPATLASPATRTPPTRHPDPPPLPAPRHPEPPPAIAPLPVPPSPSASQEYRPE